MVDPHEIVKQELEASGAATPRAVAARGGVSRQQAHTWLSRMVEAGELRREGQGRSTHYVRASAGPSERAFDFVRAGLEEHQAWRQIESAIPALGDLPKPAAEILYYAFAEMMNNAIDHSESERILARVELGADRVRVVIEDFGIGALQRIQQSLHLASPLEALQQVSKGKLTTAPEAHTGLGLFFTSKAVELFELCSDSIRWLVDNRTADMAVFDVVPRKGTEVAFEVDRATTRDLKALFDTYSRDFEVTRTRVTVKLFRADRRYVSRSEARQILLGLEKFEEVFLDFSGVSGIGQGFADEVFRVWPSRNPGTTLTPIHTGPAVEFMIGLARKRAP